jgi:hypothetical protein
LIIARAKKSDGFCQRIQTVELTQSESALPHLYSQICLPHTMQRYMLMVDAAGSIFTP